jgi:hypothetical protein
LWEAATTSLLRTAFRVDDGKPEIKSSTVANRRGC